MRERIEKLLERAGVEELDETHEGFMSACPLPRHDDSTPSFTINVETGLWICFGCDASGNLPMLAAEILDIPMSEAMRGWIVEDDTWHELPERTEGKSIDTVPETWLSPYGRCPVYMLDRGFRKQLLKHFEIGYDLTENRVVFPIRNVDGGLVGLTKRACTNEVWPKYKHTTFEKSNHLYLAHMVKKRLGVTPRGHPLVIVVEGHVDALRLWQILGGLFLRGPRRALGFLSLEFVGAVATMGGGLSKQQARVLAMLDIPHVVLAMDHDEAGEKYEEKSIEALLDVGVRSMYRLEFPGADPGDLESHHGLQLVTL